MLIQNFQLQRPFLELPSFADAMEKIQTPLIIKSCIRRKGNEKYQNGPQTYFSDALASSVVSESVMVWGQRRNFKACKLVLICVHHCPLLKNFHLPLTLETWSLLERMLIQNFQLQRPFLELPSFADAMEKIQTPLIIKSCIRRKGNEKYQNGPQTYFSDALASSVVSESVMVWGQRRNFKACKLVLVCVHHCPLL